MEQDWDCLVVGGGAAGLSAALVLGRARQRTLVVDTGEQSNLSAHGIGGLLGYDQRPPAELYAAGRRELTAYPSVELRSGSVVGGKRDGDGFVLELADGERVATRRVLLATGMEYRYPDLPGVAERWGQSVFHCPFCHGWEHRDRALGVLDRGPAGVHRATLLREWSDDVTLLADGSAELDDADAERLRAAGITVDERPVTGLRGQGEELEAVTFDDGSARSLEGLLVPVVLHQRSALAEQLGAATEENMLAADAVVVGFMSRTEVDGLSAAGDVCAQMPSVAAAVAAGHTAAAGMVQAIVAERHGLGAR